MVADKADQRAEAYKTEWAEDHMVALQEVGGTNK